MLTANQLFAWVLLTVGIADEPVNTDTCTVKTEECAPVSQGVAKTPIASSSNRTSASPQHISNGF